MILCIYNGFIIQVVILLLNPSGDLTSYDFWNKSCLSKQFVLYAHNKAFFFFFPKVGVIPGITEYAEKSGVEIPG